MSKQSVVIRLNTLLNKTCKIITSNSLEFEKFLKGIAPTYKYSFAEQLMIYGQNPIPTAVATMSQWNRMGLWVNTNAPKIEIFLKGQLYSLYDIADVNSRHGNRAYIWNLKNEYEQEVLKNLSERYRITIKDDFGGELPKIIEAVMAEKDLDNLPYSDLLKRSCQVLVSARTNHAVWRVSGNFLGDITAYSNYIMEIGAHINSVSRDILDIIEKTVRVLDTERMTQGGQKNVIGRNQSELSTGRSGIHDTEHRVSESDELGQVRENETGLPVRTQSTDVRTAASGRDTGTTSQRSGRRSSSESARVSGSDEAKGQSGRESQEHRPDEMGGNDEQLQTQRRRNRTKRTNSRVNKQNKKDERAEDIPSSALPYIEQLVYCGEVDSEVKFAIYDFFNEHHSQQERIDYLVNRYNNYGHSLDKPYLWLDCKSKAKGVVISYLDDTPEKYTVSYGQIASLIDERINNGTYLPKSLKGKYDIYHQTAERHNAKNKLVEEIRNIIRLYNSNMDRQKRFNDTLNLYFLTDCTSMYNAGIKRSTAVHSSGDLILPALKKALETVIKNDNELSERAVAAIAVLNSDLSLEVMPTPKETAFQDALDNNDFKLQSGDIIYINLKKLVVADVQDTQVTFYDENAPLILSQMDKAVLNEALTHDRRNEQYLNIDAYIEAEPLPQIEVGSGFVDIDTPAEQKPLEEKTAISITDDKTASKAQDKITKHWHSDEMWERYQQIKAEHTNGILLMRIGDFYEAFGDDAKQMSEALEITLTRRQIHDSKGNITYISMTGVPGHSMENNINRLLGAGYRVLVVENLVDEPKAILPHSELRIEDAKKFIDDFCKKEYANSEGADYSDYKNVEIAYTTTGDGLLPIQVSVDLINWCINKEVNFELVEREQYDSLDALIETALSNLEFSELVYVDEEKLYPIYRKELVGKDITIDNQTWTIEQITEVGEVLLQDYSSHEDYGSTKTRVAKLDDIAYTYNQQELQKGLQGNEKKIATITCLWSENSAFEEGKEYSVYEFDELMYELDTKRSRGWKALLARHHNDENEAEAQEENLYYRYIGYDKTAFRINLPDGTTLEERQDIGDGFGGVVDFIESNTAYVNVFPQLIEAIRTTNPEALDEDVIIREDKPENFRITDIKIGEGTPRERYKANIRAIEILKTIEHENRYATEEEKVILSRYVGWGGLSEAFDEYNYGWQSEYKELKELLDSSEYEAALSSVNTAFYTPPTVIDAIYQVLENNGVTKGKILEPACGIGNFFGRLPETISNYELHGVELDSISGRIAKALYPNADIQIKGFEKAEFADNSFDVVIGNVPFGDFKVYDTEYKNLNFMIHDYFFAKALDKVKPGGIVAFITAQGTLDKKQPTVRKYIAQRAELVGAIRLPRGTFKAAAGTDVTSDIVILQKREKAIEIEPSWVHLDKEIKNNVPVNSYFVDHPRMMCGEMRYVSGQHGSVPRCIIDENDNFDILLNRAVNYIRFNYQNTALSYENTAHSSKKNSIPADPTVHNFSFTTVDNEIYYRTGSIMALETLKGDKKEQLKSLIELRECVRNLLSAEINYESDDIVTAQMHELNQLYDSYQKKYGYINSRAASQLFDRDDSYYLLCSLEIWNDGKYNGKSDVFFKRTIRANQTVSTVDTAAEALSLSLGEKAKVDIGYMSALTGKDEETLYQELFGTIFHNPLYNPETNAAEKYLTAEDYLSGNVREKLAIARRYAKNNPADYSINVEALEKVQPIDLKATEIDVRLGSTWIPASDVQEFMYEIFNTPTWAHASINLSFNEVTSEWYISKKSLDMGVQATSTYGTKRINGYAILENSLNLRDTKIFDYHDNTEGKRIAVLNTEETQKAQNKQREIEEVFNKWIWQEPSRRNRLTELYNKKFNSYRPREYDGSYLRFVGTNPEITLRKHQVDAIARIIHGGNTLLAHVVGAGKTFEMVAAAQEMKRLGLCTKSMFVVPNHIVEQFASEYYQLYPTANLLVTTKKDFETANRKKFCARIATGDYDAIIIGHSQFEKIPMSVQAQEAVLNEQLADIRAAIDASRERYTVKQLESQKKKVIAKLEKLRDQTTKDDVVTFEELGIDRLFVDEAHYFKNLSVITKMGNVAGISTAEAKKSSDLFMKIRYLDSKTGGKGVIFATGTPVSNSMVEMYTMMKYLNYDGLKSMELINFDAWASTFGEIVNAIELSPEGNGYRSKKRFAKFHNIPELRNMFSEFADVKTADMLNLNVPDAIHENIVLKPSKIQQEIVKTFAVRAEDIRNKKVDSTVDNMLKITNDGRKVALDQRLYDPLLPDSEGSKVTACANKVHQIWLDTQDDKLTQLVFCDLSTPKSNGEFNIYDDLKEKLVLLGIPESDIAYMHSANTEKAKQELFKKVRNGTIRILIGSTQKMGAGTNVQDKLIALHHLDCPWRPSDLQQREGRIIRQGNQNEKVYLYTYLTENTFDSYLYQIIVNKQKFISQLMTSKTPVRVAEDVDEVVLNYSEIMALASGDPRIKEKIELDSDVANLKMMESDYLDQKYILQDRLAFEFPKQLSFYQNSISNISSDIEMLKGYSEDKDYPIEIDGVKYYGKDKTEAGNALLKATGVTRLIGHYKGFDMIIGYDMVKHCYTLTLQRAAKYIIELSKSNIGNITRIDNAIKGMPEKLKSAENHLENVQTQIKSAKDILQLPFPKADELAIKQARLNELNIALDLDKPQKSNQEIERKPL